MAYSKITIDFNIVPTADQVLNINESKLSLNINEIFKAVRASNYQVELPVFEPDDGIHPDRWMGNVATFYKNAVNVDYNTLSLFTITTILDAAYSGTGSVVITANYENAVFSITSNTSGADITIENQTPITPINVLSATYSAGSLASNIVVNVTTDIQATKMNTPIVVDPITTNPFTFTYSRSETKNIQVATADAVSGNFAITTPDELKLANTTIGIINTPSGATVTVVVNYISGLTLEYSMDNVTWQTSNLFSGILDGSYTMYIREQFGFSISKAFTVTDTVGGSITVTPSFIIPIPNSIRFAQRYATKKNINTTLSNEEDCRLPFCTKQMFLTTDVIKTQVKTSYDTLTAYITNGVTETPISIEKKTAYIGAKDKRDANIRRRSDGRLGVSFISGNIYDYDTDVVTGVYELEGNVPSWASVGSFFNVTTLGWVAIVDIIRDETDSYWELVSDYNYTGIPFTEKVFTIYNAQNYEVYEFEITMTPYKDTQIQVVIEATNTGWDDVGYISEIIEVKDSYENVVEIEYWNDTNVGQMYYQTLITNKMIHDGLVTNYKPDGKQDVHLGDTSAILVDSTLNNTFELIIFEVTTAIVRQIAFAMSHKYIQINDLLYIANDKIDAEKIGEHTNLYNVKVKLIEAGNFYAEENSTERTYGDLTGLLTAEYDYIKI